jgi:hypothetical protein
MTSNQIVNQLWQKKTSLEAFSRQYTQFSRAQLPAESEIREIDHDSFVRSVEKWMSSLVIAFAAGVQGRVLATKLASRARRTKLITSK